MTVPVFSASSVATDKDGRPSQTFLSWMQSVRDAIMGAQSTADAAAPASTILVASGGLHGTSALNDAPGIVFYRAKASVSTINTITGASTGDWVYATDGCKPGETTGNGSGVPCYRSGGAWVSVHSAVAVTA